MTFCRPCDVALDLTTDQRDEPADLLGEVCLHMSLGEVGPTSRHALPRPLAEERGVRQMAHGMSDTEPVLPDPLLKPETVARWLAVSKSTLVRWRQSGRGPTVVWLSDDLPRYRASDVQAWLDARAA